jgi:hypothetical protein
LPKFAAQNQQAADYAWDIGISLKCYVKPDEKEIKNKNQ